jgi:hypothetical protein
MEAPRKMKTTDPKGRDRHEVGVEFEEFFDLPILAPEEVVDAVAAADDEPDMPRSDAS